MGRDPRVHLLRREKKPTLSHCQSQIYTLDQTLTTPDQAQVSPQLHGFAAPQDGSCQAPLLAFMAALHLRFQAVPGLGSSLAQQCQTRLDFLLSIRES